MLTSTTSTSSCVRTVPPLERRSSPDELVGLRLECGTRDVARRLLRHGASPAFVRAVLARVLRAEARGTHAIDAALEVLAQALAIMPSPRRPGPAAPRPLLALVGPAGAGKSTTLARLALRLRATGRHARLASLGPSSELAVRRAGLGQVPEPVHDSDQLRRLVARSGPIDALLLDTPGLAPRDLRGLEALERLLAPQAELCDVRPLLVLPAPSSRGALQLTTNAFARLRPQACVVTRLDETDEPATVVEALIRARLPLAFLCDGPDPRRHLLRPTAEDLAQLALCGHLPRRAA